MSNNETVAAYPGAKAKLREALMPLAKVTGINVSLHPFGGMGSEFLAMVPYKIEIYNDLDYNLYRLFLCICDGGKRDRLFDTILEMPYEEEQYNRSIAITRGKELGGLDEVTYAAHVWYTLLNSQNGSRKIFRGLVKGTEELEFKNKVLNKYQALSRFDGVQVQNRDALELIPEYKMRSDVFIFSDSEYCGPSCTAKRHYDQTIDDDWQRRYAYSFEGAKCSAMVCGYDNPIYKEILEDRFGWHKYEIAEVYKSMGYVGLGEGKTAVVECCWVNYDIHDL